MSDELRFDLGCGLFGEMHDRAIDGRLQACENRFTRLGDTLGFARKLDLRTQGLFDLVHDDAGVHGFLLFSDRRAGR
jgi:hypothetical protein